MLGPHDFVSIVEAPDDQSISRVSAQLSSRGVVRIMTLAAIPIDDCIAALAGSDRPVRATPTQEPFRAVEVHDDEPSRLGARAPRWHARLAFRPFASGQAARIAVQGCYGW